MKSLMFGLTLLTSVMTSVAFAEGGSDRLIERMQRNAQAQAHAHAHAQASPLLKPHDTAKPPPRDAAKRH